MKTLITSMALAMLFAVSANADVIHQSDFEADGASQGTGFNILPGTLDFYGGGGDHVGTAGQGLSNGSGSFSYVVDLGNTADNGNGWGATWAGIGSNSQNTSGGFTTQADAIANGGSYIQFTPGVTTFTASADIATDAVDALTGSGSGHVRFEFLANGAEVNQADRQFSNLIDASNATAAFQTVNLSYTITAADIANGIDSVNVAFGTDGSGFGNTDGLLYFDNLLFEVDGASVITVEAIPEPSSAGLLVACALSICGIRRRKS